MVLAKELYESVERVVETVFGRHLLPFVRECGKEYEAGHYPACQLLQIRADEVISQEKFEQYVKYLVAFHDHQKIMTLAQLQKIKEAEIRVKIGLPEIESNFKRLMENGEDIEVIEMLDEQMQTRPLYSKPAKEGQVINITEVEESTYTFAKLDFFYKVCYQKYHVWRKESDFVELRAMLACQDELVGLIIPILPGFGLLGRINASQVTLAQRMEQLEEFLTKVVQKKELKNSRPGKKFLQRGKFDSGKSETLERLNDELVNFSFRDNIKRGGLFIWGSVTLMRKKEADRDLAELGETLGRWELLLKEFIASF